MNEQNNKLTKIIIIVLIILSLSHIYPITLSLVNPKKNVEDTLYGKFIVTYLHGTEFKDAITWLAFIILDILLIYYCIKKINNKPLLILIILLLIYIPILLVFPVTVVHNFFLKQKLTPNKPFIYNVNDIFPQNEQLEKNFDIYKKELDNYMNSQTEIDCVHNKTPGFIIGKNGDLCWRTLQIKTAGTFVEGIENICPEIYKILNTKIVNNAFLSILDPHVNIPKHTGYSRAYLRYHLGIDIPKSENKPFIICGDEKYTWQEGKGIIFDDMYVHYVENPTDERRVVLYIDLIRPELLNDPITNTMIDMINNNPIVKRYNKSQHTSRDN